MSTQSGPEGPRPFPTEVKSNGLSRRDVMKRGVAIAAGLAATTVLRRDGLSGLFLPQGAEAEQKVKLSTPVTKEERDPRVKDIAQTRFEMVDEVPFATPVTNTKGTITGWGLNKDKYSEIEGQNRVDLASANALARIQTANFLLDGAPYYDELTNMLRERRFPPVPDFAKFLRDLKTEEIVPVDFLVLPKGADFDFRKLQRRTANAKNGILFRLSPDEQFNAIGRFEGKQFEGATIRVEGEGKDAQVIVDVFIQKPVDERRGYGIDELAGFTASLTLSHILDRAILFQNVVADITRNGTGIDLNEMYYVPNYQTDSAKNGFALYPEITKAYMRKLHKNDDGTAWWEGPGVVTFQSPDLK